MHTINLSNRRSNYSNRTPDRVAKRSLDIIVAGLALFLLLPLLLLIGVLVWADDRKNPIFRHMRVGRGGRRFGCLKFRSMVTDGDAMLNAHLASSPAARREWEETHKLTNDPRVTQLGSVLRKTSLDELPQPMNVRPRRDRSGSASARAGEGSSARPRAASDDVGSYAS